MDPRLSFTVIVSLVLACGSSRPDDGLESFGGDGIGGTNDPAGGDAGDDGSGAVSDSAGNDGGGDADGDGGGVKLDVGGGAGDGDGGDLCVGADCGCTAVDLLFVIDNSSSMGDHQVAIGQAFPGFADAIVEALPPGTNLHVGVTSTEMGHSGEGSTTNCTATGDGGQPAANFYVTPDQQNSGRNGAQGRLYEAEGKYFFEIDTDASPAELQELKDWFAAASHIGEGGSNIEMSAAAAGWAFDPANSTTNAGFVRDAGAVLVLFFLQDEPDQTPSSALPELLDKIVAAKASCGGMNCVVGGGFLNETCLPEVPLGGMLDSMVSAPVTKSIPFFGELTPEDYDSLLRDTLAQVIAQTCASIPPEG